MRSTPARIGEYPDDNRESHPATDKKGGDQIPIELTRQGQSLFDGVGNWGAGARWSMHFLVDRVDRERQTMFRLIGSLEAAGALERNSKFLFKRSYTWPRNTSINYALKGQVC